MPPEKKSNKKTVKKTPAAGPAKKKAAGQQNLKSGGNNTAFFVLIIIVLITIIILMLNRFYDKGILRLPDLKKIFPQSEKIIRPEIKQQDERKSSELKPDAVKEPEKTKEKKEGEPEEEIKPAGIQKSVNIYLLRLDEKTEKIYLSPVKRTVSDSDILNSSLNILIKGPNQKEKERGFITAVPQNLKIRGISVKGKTAEIDFDGSIEEGAAGDILLKRVQQIVYTSTQFDNIESIIIRINGQRRSSMGSDGFSISGPLKR